MKQKIFEVGKKAYTFNQARYEEDMGRCVITAVSERFVMLFLIGSFIDISTIHAEAGSRTGREKMGNILERLHRMDTRKIQIIKTNW